MHFENQIELYFENVFLNNAKKTGISSVDYSRGAGSSGSIFASTNEPPQQNNHPSQKANIKRKKRRHRTIFTQYQVDELEKAFQVSPIYSIMQSMFSHHFMFFSFLCIKKIH